MKRPNEITIEGARLIFRNFSGRKDEYNKAGKRMFSIIVEDPALIDRLLRDGYTLKPRPKASEDEPDSFTLKVSVRFEQFPPNIHMLTKHNRVLLDEDSVGQLDYAEIFNTDLVITPYSWTVNGKSGITAYLKNMYITIIEDELASKYEAMDTYY